MCRPIDAPPDRCPGRTGDDLVVPCRRPETAATPYRALADRGDGATAGPDQAPRDIGVPRRRFRAARPRP
ncbi:hypothetical protein GCM10023195_10120 [Actinoallomurus liliacearum]|uniref:Uncharacterized protein n=1 Tax=Actinoallomurus liliacearum TaxID=1080073 RepID=A0ABP8TG60_9ACTN